MWVVWEGAEWNVGLEMSEVDEEAPRYAAGSGGRCLWVKILIPWGYFPCYLTSSFFPLLFTKNLFLA